MKLADIKLNEKNPRLIKDERFKKLVKSVKDFPAMMELRPIVVNKDMKILGGNMRYRACQELGMNEIPDTWVRIADSLTEDEQRRFIVEDNVPFGEWDWEVLANEWESSDLTEWGLEIDKFIHKEAEEDDYEIPDEIQTDIVLGDLFEIGQHRLLCGDATNSTDWEKLNIQKGTVCFTSPPYNAGDSAKLSGNVVMSNKKNFYETHDDHQSDNSYSGLIQESLSNAITFTDVVAFNVQLLAGNKTLLIDWLSNNKGVFVDILTWNKGHSAPAMAEGVCSSSFEWICIFSKDNHSRRIPLSSWRGTISNVYSGPPQRNNEFSKVHAATFPIHLPTFIIADLMNRCTGVIDCFLGTGTTMVAAHQLNRKCYGMEIDPKYCQVVIDRMKKLDPTLTIKKNGIAI